MVRITTLSGLIRKVLSFFVLETYNMRSGAIRSETLSGNGCARGGRWTKLRDLAPFRPIFLPVFFFATGTVSGRLSSIPCMPATRAHVFQHVRVVPVHMETY